MKSEFLNEFLKLDAFLEFYLTDGDFNLDILDLVNLISSRFPNLSWESKVWKKSSVED